MENSTDSVVTIEGKCKVVEATQAHVERLYPFLRKIDKLEVSCMDLTPREALMSGLKHDDITLTAIDPYGVPMAMFGVGQIEQKTYIWCLGTDGVEEYAYHWIRASRKYVKGLVRPYNVAFNYVHKENHTAIKWLKFCGAYFLRELSFNDQPFYEFVITSK